MQVLNSYFDKLVFTKVDQKEGFTIYAASLSSSYGDGKKTYALVFVPVHMAILDKAYLKDLHWQNFQTRILSNGWKLPSQRWDMSQLKGIPTPMFDLVDRNEARTKYSCKSEQIEMLLLHDPKKKSNYQYGNKINLIAALITFKCILNFVKGHERLATRDVYSTSVTHDQPYLNSIGHTLPQQRSQVDISSIPISSLATKIPGHDRQSYTPSSLPSNTSYVPRNEGTRYAANGQNTSGYEFGSSLITGGTGYTKLSLDFSPVSGGEEEYEGDLVDGQSYVDGSFELL